MRTITETWAAAESKTFTIRGGRFEILESAYPVDVSFQDDNGAELTNGKAQNIGAGSYRDAPFGRLVITSSQAQQIKILISDGDAGTRSIAGTVQVVDGGKARTLAGVAFFGYTYSGSQNGNFAHAQILNPEGSGVRMVIEQIGVGAFADDVVRLGSYGTALANLHAVTAQNKHVGAGAASVAQMRWQEMAGLLAINTWMMDIYVKAKQTQTIKLSEPIVLNPGRGLVVQGYLANATVNANYEWYEEKI